MKKGWKFLKNLAWTLLIIGGLNWGLVGAFNFNLVYAIFQAGFFANLIYVLVGLSAAFLLVHKLMKKRDKY